ncbi:preprotein translocase subunit SecE [Sphingomonas changnyeongensis]|uniref:Protein translocase subunit SecE n=1 Tax=Sphingomonas changnyeongensis TaxID=2698679 RepID=A0A7Z2NYM4_9SPHN|nr:preprotein translocase subunit SecE [Sphingomonas changnyeongensis]
MVRRRHWPGGAVHPEHGQVNDVAGKGIGNIPQFVQQVRTETAKVSWPTSRETVMTTVMVLIMTGLLGIFFFGIDRAFAAIVKLLLSLAA